MPSNVGLFPVKLHFYDKFEIVITLSEQNTSQTLHLQNNCIAMNSWQCCLLPKNAYTHFS